MYPVDVSQKHTKDPAARDMLDLYSKLYHGPLSPDPKRSGQVNETAAVNIEMAVEIAALNRLYDLAGLGPYSPPVDLS